MGVELASVVKDEELLLLIEYIWKVVPRFSKKKNLFVIVCTRAWRRETTVLINDIIENLLEHKRFVVFCK